MVIAAFVVSLAVIILTVVIFKLHPFLSLIIGALVMGLMSGMAPITIMEKSLQVLGVPWRILVFSLS